MHDLFSSVDMHFDTDQINRFVHKDSQEPGFQVYQDFFLLSVNNILCYFCLSADATDIGMRNSHIHEAEQHIFIELNSHDVLGIIFL